MAPLVIDLRSARDPDEMRDNVHRAVQALAEGQLVAFPTETVYTVAASGLSDRAVGQLLQLAPGEVGQMPVLAVKSADEAIDYVPDLCPLAQRLARRCWPGPITLVVHNLHPESLLRQLAPSVQNALTRQGELALRVPAHHAMQDVLRLLAGPVVQVNALRPDRQEAVTAQEVLESWGHSLHLVLDDGRSRFGQPSSVVRVLDGRFEIVRLGVVSEQTIKRLASVIVLFICTGNTCRSPMAEAMFRQRVSERLGCGPDQVEDRGIIIMSAGIAAMMGSRPSPEAVTVMGAMGIDLSSHESQPLTEQLVRHADLILTMTRSHRQAILTEWPDAAERTKMLCRDGSDVADPVGGPAELYRRCAAQISEQLTPWVDDLSL